MTSDARQLDPVSHQAHARLILSGNQPITAFSEHGALILNLHPVRLIETVFQVGEDTPKHLQRLTLRRDDQLPVNAAL